MRFRLALLLLAPLALAACRTDAVPPPPAAAPAPPPEERVRLIPLAGPLASSDAEISGLTWYGDRLILLPQYPGRFAVGADTVDMAGAMKDEGTLFALTAADLLAFLDGTHSGALRPQEIRFTAPGVAGGAPGFEGYEAIVFQGDRVFVIIETLGAGATHGFLVAGTVTRDGAIRLDAETLEPLPPPPQARLDNLSYETLLATPDGVIAMQEANGAVVNPTSEAYHYDGALYLRDSLRVPPLEYRLTDATGVDSAGRFWVMNYFYPGDRAVLQPGPDALEAEFGLGATHRRWTTVERLVELRLDGGRIVRTGRAPIQLELLDEATPRNWEGVARLGERGFVAATDKYPETMLAFIPAPPDTTREDLP